MTGPDYAARAAAGAEFLDGQVPGWAGQIDLGRLDLRDDCDCVLGQIAGRYDDGLDDFSISRSSDEIALGFLPGDDGWQELTEAWAAEIGKRREPATVTP